MIASEPNRASSEAAKGADAATLLIVDDDEHVRRALGRALRRSGCRIVVAANGAEGLGAIERESVQVVVSDYQMPGMTGVQFLRAVKERWPRIQRILLTGQADPTAIEEAVNQSEIFRFVSKPWDDAHLLLTIQGAIDQYRVVAENERLHALLEKRNQELEGVNRELDLKLEVRSRALTLAAEEWNACFDALGDPLAIVDRECRVLRANRAFAVAAAVPVQALAGHRCREGAFEALPCPSCAFGAALGRAPAEKEVGRGGRIFRLGTFPFRSGSAVCTYRDVTDEKAVARRMLQTEKMAAVGQLAGGVAHEINNPLGGILAFAQIMKKETRPKEDVEALSLIEDAAVRAKKIVESLLRFSRRPKEGERGRVEVAKVVEDALFLLQPQLNDGRVKVARALGEAWVVGNANQIQQIVVNLCSNALHAMRGTGTISLATSRQPDGKVRLVVADDGPGIAPENLEHIFEPFFTTKPEGEGTGLGLAICYRIVEEHGGNIRVESELGQGATFTIELPAAP